VIAFNLQQKRISESENGITALGKLLSAYLKTKQIPGASQRARPADFRTEDVEQGELAGELAGEAGE
jgi:hypothetical protein